MSQNCKNYEENLEKCNCTYTGCPRKGYCCECIHYHRAMNQLPACFFNEEQEKTYDRSVENFIRMHQ